MTICHDECTSNSSCSDKVSSCGGGRDSLSCNFSLMRIDCASAWSMLGILDEFPVEGIEPARESDLEPFNEGLDDRDEVLRSRVVPVRTGSLIDFGRLVALPILFYSSSESLVG